MSGQAHGGRVPGRAMRGAKAWYAGSAAEDFVTRLRSVEFVSTTTLFGAMFMLSALPFIILISSFADRPVEDGIADHLGLNDRASHIVGGLFESSAQRSTGAVAFAVVLTFFGSIGVSSAIQEVYERVFGEPHPRKGNFLRQMVWVVALCAWLGFDGVVSSLTHDRPAGMLLDALLVLAATTGFILWSMHFLLHGRRPWRTLVVPAIATAVFWLGLEGFAALYFSATITSDSRLYGSVGVIFSLLTWFIAIAAVVSLGALAGDVLQQRRTAPRDRGR